MSFPTLKYPRLCRILIYLVVIGFFCLPIPIVLCLPFVPEVIELLVCFLCPILLLIYIFREFPVLMGMDIFLATLSCVNSARTQYALPAGFRAETLQRRILRFGKAKAPTASKLPPAILRYRLDTPMTIYSSGIEKIITVYHAEYLDMQTYRAILSSAKTNAKQLKGSQKPCFLDKEQKASPLNQVLVIFLLAKAVEPGLSQQLHKEVCKQAGDGSEQAYLPCILDLQNRLCICDSERLPYVGYQYPVKNRGIRLIRNLVFGGRFPLRNNHFYVTGIKDSPDLETTLWSFWRDVRQEFGMSMKQAAKQFQNMSNGQIQQIGDALYIKWDGKGLLQHFKLDTMRKTASVEPIDSWHHPKVQPIAKKTIAAIQAAVASYFSGLGYTVEYIDVSELFSPSDR